MAEIIVCLPAGDSPIAAASDKGLPATRGAAGRVISRKGLTTDAELGDESLVAVLVLALEVVEQCAAVRHHLEQATA
jgi:hypothetical protein